MFKGLKLISILRESGRCLMTGHCEKRAKSKQCFAIYENIIWLTFLQYSVTASPLSASWSNAVFSILKPRSAVFPIGFATGQSHNRTFFLSVREHFLLSSPRVSASCKKCKRILLRRVTKFNLLRILILFLAC